MSPISVTSLGDMRTQSEVRSLAIRQKHRQKLRNAFIERATKHGSIKNLFNALDTENTGGISLNEFRRALEKMG
jgi:Ca2+-binding EF-hand superfamily protein